MRLGGLSAIDPYRVLARAFEHPPMRRLQVASAAWSAGEAAYLVGMFVFAFAAGGAGAVALIAVLRTVPSVVLAPILTTLAGDRPAETLLRATLVVRVVCVSIAAALLVGDAPATAIYLLVAVDAVAATLLRPIRGSLLPAIARSPGELVAGNVALTTGDSLANLVGPILAAGALVVGGPAVAFVPGLALLGIAAITAFGIDGAQPLMVRGAGRTKQAGSGVRWRPGTPTIALVGTFTAQRFVRGALTVLLVAAAIDLLDMGDAGVGVLTAAIGLGGLAGGVLAVGLVGRLRLAPWFALGLVVWSAGIAVVGAVPLPAVALLALAIGGVGKVLIDSAGFSLLQRTVPNEFRTRALGMQEGLVTAALALGAVVATGAIEALGIGPALVWAGVLPIVLVGLLWHVLGRLDRDALVHDRELRLLEALPLFRPLQLAIKEELAAGMGRQAVAAGETVVRQGEPGDHFYIVEEGELEVVIDGRPTGRLTAGHAFGEIALLRDVPRTATVRACTDGALAVIARAHFLAAVTGHRESAVAAERLVVERLGA